MAADAIRAGNPETATLAVPGMLLFRGSDAATQAISQTPITAGQRHRCPATRWTRPCRQPGPCHQRAAAGSRTGPRTGNPGLRILHGCLAAVGGRARSDELRARGGRPPHPDQKKPQPLDHAADCADRPGGPGDPRGLAVAAADRLEHPGEAARAPQSPPNRVRKAARRPPKRPRRRPPKHPRETPSPTPRRVRAQAPPCTHTMSVPNLFGMDGEQAAAALRELGLTPNEGQAQESDLVAGTVIGQSPRVGVKVEPGTTITYILSLGPRRSRTPDPDRNANAKPPRRRSSTPDRRAPRRPADDLVFAAVPRRRRSGTRPSSTVRRPTR